MTFTAVIVPVPLESVAIWETFKPFVERFCDTYRQFQAGATHTVIAVCNGSEPTKEVKRIFRDMSVEFLRYDGGGADLGSFQFACKTIDPCFAVCCVSRVYFHRAGWLKRLVDARKHFGPGLYGTSASMEGGSLHICCRMYGMDSTVFAKYPHEITSRDQGTFVEVGRGNPNGDLAAWHQSQGLAAKLVYWSGIYPLAKWAEPANIFRRDDQSALLVWDKHSQAYADADTAEKKRLSELCFGVNQ